MLGGVGERDDCPIVHVAAWRQRGSGRGTSLVLGVMCFE